MYGAQGGGIETGKTEAPDGLRTCDAGCPSLMPPWSIGGEYAFLQRWIYQGTGTTTHSLLNDAREARLWSQEDDDGPLELTNSQRIRLRQALQLTVKGLRLGAKAARGQIMSLLDDRELCLLQDVLAQVEPGPCHNPRLGLLQFRIKPLQQTLSATCVFFSQALEDVPKGSVADGQPKLKGDDNGQPPVLYKPPPVDTVSKGEDQNELFECYKYGRKVGAIRKKYVKEDRFRLLDLIEELTPAYEATFVYAGLSPSSCLSLEWLFEYVLISTGLGNRLHLRSTLHLHTHARTHARTHTQDWTLTKKTTQWARQPRPRSQTQQRWRSISTSLICGRTSSPAA